MHIILNEVNMKKIVLVGGGTAGHIMPNLALLPYLNDNNYEVYYIGADNETDRLFLNNYNIKKYFLPIVKLERKFTLKNALIPFRLIKSINQTKKILKKIQPDIIFSKGGFVGLPVSIANKKLNIPFILHESDYSMGLSNKLAQKYASKLLTTFADTITKYPEKTICVGSPIRKEISLGKINNFDNYEKLDKNKKTILIIGGSQGSKFFNDFFILNAEKICQKFNIILITGKQEVLNNALPNNFIKIKNVPNIEDYYATADIIVTRGGANTLFELLSVKKLMIINYI